MQTRNFSAAFVLRIISVCRSSSCAIGAVSQTALFGNNKKMAANRVMFLHRTFADGRCRLKSEINANHSKQKRLKQSASHNAAVASRRAAHRLGV